MPDTFDKAWALLPKPLAGHRKGYKKGYRDCWDEHVKPLKELLKTTNNWCEKCGCTELLCGHNKRD